MSRTAGLRRWHTWLASCGWALTVFLAVTGVLINHPQFFHADQAVAEEWQARLSATELAGDRLQLVEAVRASGPVVGRLQDVADDGSFIDLRFAGPAGSTEISIDRTDGRVDAYAERAGTVAWLGHLHRGKDASLAWKLLLDGVAVLLIASAVTGVCLVGNLPKRRLWGFVLIGAGGLLPLLLLAFA